MKKYALLFSLIVLIACEKKDTVAEELIKRNNTMLRLELEATQGQMLFEKYDKPFQYDEKFYNEFAAIIRKINSVSTQDDCKTLLDRQQKLAESGKIALYPDQPKSGNIAYLKNSLYLNALYIGSSRLARGTHCGTGDLYSIWETVKGDSITLDFRTPNLFVVETDSITAGKQKIIDYTGDDDRNFWRIKYKTPKKQSVYHGKLFYNNGGKLILLERFQDTIREY